MFSIPFFKVLYDINIVMVTLLSVCYFNQALYMVLSIFLRKKRWKATDVRHRYAFVIPARNEESVIAGLLDSIRAQNYPKELISVIVIADNCTDRTAAIAAEKGAIVIERFNPNERTKGYALRYAAQQIMADERFRDVEGFFIFDADNLLHPDYLLEMNKAFDSGCRVVTGYRTTKNFADNWLSANSSLMYLREARHIHYCRASLGFGTYVSGTGYVVDREHFAQIAQRPFRTLTEDVELSAILAAAGEKIYDCPEAVFYDEQPTRFRDFVLQRLRWCKGNHQVFATQGKNLTLSLLRKPSFTKWGMWVHILPLPAISFIWFVLYLLLGLTWALVRGIPFDILMAECLSFSLINFAYPFVLATLCGLLLSIQCYKELDAGFWTKIKHALLFPVGMYLLFPITVAALFVRVEWKTTRHNIQSNS